MVPASKANVYQGSMWNRPKQPHEYSPATARLNETPRNVMKQPTSSHHDQYGCSPTSSHRPKMISAAPPKAFSQGMVRKPLAVSRASYVVAAPAKTRTIPSSRETKGNENSHFIGIPPK